jgi:hypothetical protein
MERLFTGRPSRTDGKLTKNNLWREAGISRATMNRATDVLADWDDRIGRSPASLHDQRQAQEIADLRRQLKNNRQERQQLQDQVDAAATVIAVLLAENQPSSSPSTALTSLLSEDPLALQVVPACLSAISHTSTRELGGLLRGQRAHGSKR